MPRWVAKSLGNLTDYEINGKDYTVDCDLNNRIIKVDVDNNDVKYRYDALGRRVICKEGTSKSALIWWGNSECAEHKHTAAETDIMSHPSRLNSVIVRAVDGSKFKLEWYHKNYLDHVYVVSDDDGLIEHYRYTAFGEVTIYNELKGEWKKLAPGESTGVCEDYDGMTCGGKFIATSGATVMNSISCANNNRLRMG